MGVRAARTSSGRPIRALCGDILGGKNAGIKTCWFNPKHKPRRADIVPDFEVDRLDALRQLL